MCHDLQLRFDLLNECRKYVYFSARRLFSFLIELQNVSEYFFKLDKKYSVFHWGLILLSGMLWQIIRQKYLIELGKVMKLNKCRRSYIKPESWFAEWRKYAKLFIWRISHCNTNIAYVNYCMSERNETVIYLICISNSNKIQKKQHMQNNFLNQF